MICLFPKRNLHSLLFVADKPLMQDFDSSNNPTTRVLTLSGHLDSLQTLRLEEFIEEAQQGTCRHVILNLSKVPTMDLGGVGNLFTWYHALHINKVRLSIVAPSPMVRNTMESLHLTELISIYSSIPEAISHHPAPDSVSS
ncbi:STAS domain-containing protein [Candidatus Nitrospira allomarina]|uniref:STAS domain-containing protein n=1 Tax=Candidatus Nitrospira allomarina TaxID=3020900 RepID=A0AA96GA26_9BACT|nr:STAS domain-containing protein [Candidatus Nitrospira allomarina]WNM57953.1 STAS domain-containing protein [Candidatus Nitrospira allomarina]